MKKITLLVLSCLALATSAMAVDWPTDYTYASNGAWFSKPTYAGDDYTRATAVAQHLGIEFEMPTDAAAFDEVYAGIAGDEYGIDKLRADQTTTNANPASFKVGYSDVAIYVFVKYDAAPASDQAVELMLCPFDKLLNAEVPEHDVEKVGNLNAVPWMRYLELGGFKLETSFNASNKFIMGSSVMGVTNGVNGFKQNQPSWEGLNLKDCSDAESVKVVFEIAFYALDDTKNEVEFSKAVWKAASGTKGLSFEAKFKKGASCEYLWNTNNNDVYYQNSYAGYLVKGDDISVDGAAADAGSKLLVAGDLVKLTGEAGTIQIFNAAGILVASVSDETELSTSGLAAGVYIAVSGNESVSFVK